jgi:hypothetical protein
MDKSFLLLFFKKEELSSSSPTPTAGWASARTSQPHDLRRIHPSRREMCHAVAKLQQRNSVEHRHDPP